MYRIPYCTDACSSGVVIDDPLQRWRGEKMLADVIMLAMRSSEWSTSLGARYHTWYLRTDRTAARGLLMGQRPRHLMGKPSKYRPSAYH